MVRASDREALKHIAATCDDLRDLAATIDQQLIGHLLEMVIVEVKKRIGKPTGQ